MKPRRKRMLSLLLAALLLLLMVLPGCRQESEIILPDPAVTEDDGEWGSSGEVSIAVRENAFSCDAPIILRLLVSSADFNEAFVEQVDALIQAYNAVYPDVTIKVTNLTSHNRENVMKKLQAELAEGKGYDLYLLPTQVETESNPFPDVNIAMRSGYFADISMFYDPDTALDTAGLVTEVMDAGLVGSARYTLPLRYDYPVTYVDLEQWYLAGFDAHSLDGGIVELMNQAMSLDTSCAMPWYNGDCLNLFPSVLDYDTREVLLTEAELTEFLSCCRQYAKLGLNWGISATGLKMFFQGDSWAQRGLLSGHGSLAYCLTETAIAKVLDMDLGMFPITGATGEIVADVTFYGAVGSACAHPAAAYELLRLFLLPQVQWEEMVNPEEPIDAAMLTNFTMSGYPVRTAGSASTLYRTRLELARGYIYYFQEELEPEQIARNEALATVELAEEEVPLLKKSVDICRYPAYEMEAALSKLLGSLLKSDEATDDDVKNAAKQYIADLKEYLYGDLGEE